MDVTFQLAQANVMRYLQMGHYKEVMKRVESKQEFISTVNLKKNTFCLTRKNCINFIRNYTNVLTFFILIIVGKKFIPPWYCDSTRASRFFSPWKIVYVPAHACYGSPWQYLKIVQLACYPLIQLHMTNFVERLLFAHLILHVFPLSGTTCLGMSNTLLKRLRTVFKGWKISFLIHNSKCTEFDYDVGRIL